MKDVHLEFVLCFIKYDGNRHLEKKKAFIFRKIATAWKKNKETQRSYSGHRNAHTPEFRSLGKMATSKILNIPHTSVSNVVQKKNREKVKIC